MSYAELQVTTHFSFLRGASSAPELFAAAAVLGIPALGVVDRNSLAGVVRAHEAAKVTGVRLVVGCRLDLRDAPSVLVYPRDREAYARLCRLLTIGKRRAGKGACELTWSDLAEHTAGMVGILLPEVGERLPSELARHREMFGRDAYVALTRRWRPREQERLHAIAAAAAAARVPTVVTNDVLYHAPDRRLLQDVVTCIREGCTIDDAGFRRERSADRFLKPPAEMVRLFPRYAEAVGRTMEIVERCPFSLDELTYQYPEERGADGMTAQERLAALTWAALPERYPVGAPDNVTAIIRHELGLIEQLGYAPYFLTVHSIVRFARSRGILCQGRGSAANSAVCFVLGITAIDPTKHDLLFERFVSQERREPPDIDVDFEHNRREEVIQWVYQTYGRDRAALTAVVTRYRARGAVREVGKALGVPEDITAALAKMTWAWDDEGVTDKQLAELNLSLSDRRLRLTLELARELMGTPRHLSQHPGGFVLTLGRLDEMVPIEPAAMVDRQVIEWDKDDIDALRMMKVDVLGLGMLGCMRGCFELLDQHKGIALDLATIPQEDPATYAMIQRADTLGVFQIESRAQMSMLPRIKPRTFYDLVIEVAIVRPGPIQGDMVHPYLRRREGKEAVSYPTPELRAVLGRTLGVPLFQEQAMRLAITCAGFTPSEADQLRRAMATFKFTGGVSAFKDKLISGMTARGYSETFAERTFTQIEGFGSYGFPESHAASFALIAYASSWMKCHHPEVFCTALLNAQPMGFYAPAQIVRDAREHGVEIRPIDVNRSRWDCTLEPRDDGALAVRLGMRLAKGLANRDGARIVGARGDEPFAGVDDLWRRASVPIAALERLAEADAFRPTLGLDRRQAIWAIRALRDDPLPLFAAADRTPAPEIVEPPTVLRPMPAGGEVVEDYQATGLTLRRHPVAFLRPDLAERGMITTAAIAGVRDHHWVDVAGLVLIRQRPGSAKGVLFITIEDETGVANLIVWPKVFEEFRRVVLTAHLLGVGGRVQREGEVTHVIVRHLADMGDDLRRIGTREAPFSMEHGRGDQVTHGGGPDARDGPAMRQPRDIYIPDLRLGHGIERQTAIQPRTRDFR